MPSQTLSGPGAHAKASRSGSGKGTEALAKNRLPLKREKEVIPIMIDFFNQEEILKSFVKSEIYDTIKEKAALLLRHGVIAIDELRFYFPEILESDVKELEAEAKRSV